MGLPFGLHFPLKSKNPAGEVSKKELIAWTKRSEIEMVKNTIVEEFDLIDVNG